MGMTTEHQEWRFYGRRVGRKLNPKRQEVLDNIYPKLSIDNLDKDGTLCPSTLFSTMSLPESATQILGQSQPQQDSPRVDYVNSGNDSKADRGPDFHQDNLQSNKVILEIGFGNGEHLAEMMRRNPTHNFIGAEPFKNGMTAFLKEINDDKLPLDNIRVHMDDAIPLVKSLAPNSIDEIYVLNPDPWHKTRHHQRRIINQSNLDEFSRIMKKGATLIMTTDVVNLIEWMVTEASLHPDFEWTATKADDWRVAQKDWIPTRYETKGAKGADHMNYLFFVKK